MPPSRPTLRRGIGLIAIVLLLGGCGFEPEYAWVYVYNHTDSPVVARSADDDGNADCHGRSGIATVVPARAVRRVGIDVTFYDAELEILNEGDGRRHVYDLDFSPFDFYEDVHVYDAELMPSGNG